MEGGGWFVDCVGGWEHSCWLDVEGGVWTSGSGYKDARRQGVEGSAILGREGGEEKVRGITTP